MFYRDIDNDSIKTQLKEYLRQYRNIDKYVTRNDFLVKKPQNLTDLLNYVSDSTFDYHINKECRQKVFAPVAFDEKYERVYINAQFSYKIKNNVDLQDVYMEFFLNNGNNASNFYRGYRFSELSKESGETNLLTVRTTFFMINNDVTNNPMFISILAKKDLDIEISDLKIKVEGLPVVQ